VGTEGLFSQGLSWPEREAAHLPIILFQGEQSVKLYHYCMYTFMAWCLSIGNVLVSLKVRTRLTKIVWFEMAL